MSISRFIRGPDAAPASQAPLPHREVSPPARTRRLVSPVRMGRAWPATIVMIALIVFMAQTTMAMALVILVVGGIVLTVVFGTTPITRPCRLIGSQDLRR